MKAELLLIIFSGTALVLSSLIIILHKHRIIWNKIWEIDRNILELNEENLALRKSICMATICNFRLDLRMPSQHGEDLWLWSYFQKRDHGFFVEVGAYDGITFSNTYFLEAMGWHGILIEPNPEKFKLCLERRSYSACINAAVSNSPESQISLSLIKGDGGVDSLSFTRSSGKHLDRIAKTGAEIINISVPALKLSKILENVEEAIDLISIDVEGAELDVLQSLDFVKHAPSVFVIEDNSFGKDKSLEEFLFKQGYKVQCRLGANILFTRIY